MKIIETNIPDIKKDNIQENKIDLADKLIHNIRPLFDEMYQEKSEKKSKLLDTYNSNTKEISTSKNELQYLITEIKRKEKVLKLIDRIDRMINSGIITDSSTQKDTIILLKIIDTLPNNKLDDHIQRTMNIISKRFGSS